MPINYDGRVELRFQYTTTISSRPLIHKHTMDLRPTGLVSATPGLPFDTLTVSLNDITTQPLDEYVDAYMLVVKPLYTAATEWNFVELWVYPEEPSQDAVFISAYDLAIAGTGAGAADTPASQGTFTFRTDAGGIMRAQFMEWRHNQSTRETAPYSLAEFNNLQTFIRGNAGAFVGRDNGKPIANVALGHGQNEKLVRKRFRST